MNESKNVPNAEEEMHAKTDLQLTGNDVTERDLASLEQFPRLENLNLSSSCVQDGWLVHLKHVPHLKVLYLGDTEISDAGLVHLEQLPELKLLMLPKTNISDAGMVHIRKLTELILLDVSHTNIGDAALVSVKDLQNLKNVSLAHTNISDKGMMHVKTLTQLEGLEIDNTNVSEQGVRCLKDLPHLRSISLCDTKVSSSDIVSLESLLPNCQFRPELKRIAISDLSEKAAEAVAETDWPRAKEHGDRLAELLGEPDLASIQEACKTDSTAAIDAINHIGHWVTVCEARRDFEKAAQYADVSIAIQKQDLLNSYRDDERDDEDFKSDLADLFTECEFQAVRYFNLNKIEHAKNVMHDALELSRRYNVPLDEDQQELVEEFELE